MNSRASVSLTVRALQAGAAFAIALLLSTIVLHVLGHDSAERAALLGVIALIATPALSLVATALEAWSRERHTAMLAVVVLGVLGLATGLALVLSR